MLYGARARARRRARRSSSRGAPELQAGAGRVRLPAARPRRRRRRLRRPDRRRARARGRRQWRRPRSCSAAADGLLAHARSGVISAARRRRPPASARACGSATSTATAASTSSRARRRSRRRPATLSYCRGRRARPDAAAARSRAPGGTSSLAVADVNRDGYADIVQGDSDARAGRDRAAGSAAARCRLWLGSRRGPRRDADHDHAGHARGPGHATSRATSSARWSRPATSTPTASPTWSSAATREDDGAGKHHGHPRRSPRATRRHGNSAFDQDSPQVPGERGARTASSGRR